MSVHWVEACGMLQWLFVLIALVDSVQFISLTSRSDGTWDRGLWMQRIELQGQRLTFRPVANLSRFAGYLSGVFDGSHVRFITTSTTETLPFTYLICSVTTQGVLDPAPWTRINRTVSRLQRDGHTGHLYAITVIDTRHVLVQIDPSQRRMDIKFTFMRSALLFRASAYDHHQHIYYVAHVDSHRLQNRCTITGIETHSFQSVAELQVPYGIANLMLNADGTVLLANAYNDRGNYLIAIDLRYRATDVLVVYSNRSSWRFRAGTLGQDDRTVYTVMRAFDGAFILLITDVTTKTYQSIKLDSAAIPYGLWPLVIERPTMSPT